MNSNRITDGVGKKIVEALKQQSDVEIIPVQEEYAAPDLANVNTYAPQSASIEDTVVPQETPQMSASFNFNNGMNTNMMMNNDIDTALNNTMMNFQHHEQAIPAAEEMELPANVAVLRQLITKIPASVSKQTGAMIIKQTMEALGISMTSVLQEAQEVQENLTQSVRECQTSVLEHKKQISMLEVQAQKYQRQFAAVNDIISLFIQTN